MTLLVSSKDRYSLLIACVLTEADNDADLKGFGSELNLTGAQEKFRRMNSEDQSEVLKMYRTAVAGDSSDTVHERAHRFLTNYRDLQKKGGVGFYDYLLSGKEHKLARIREGNTNVLLFEMAVVVRANEIMGSRDKPIPTITALLDGVDLVAVKEYLTTLSREGNTMVSNLGTSLLEQHGHKKAPKEKKPRKIPEFHVRELYSDDASPFG